MKLVTTARRCLMPTFALFALVLAAGCQMKSHFPVISSLTDPAITDAAMMTTAPDDADYLLYEGGVDAPVARSALKAGDPIGFKLDAFDIGRPLAPKGVVSGVAGTFVVPLKSGKSYEWRKVPNSSTSEKNRKDIPLIPQP